MATSVLDDIFGTKLNNAPEKISLWKIQRDGGTQMRAGLDEPTVAEYFEAMHTAGAWGSFPPLTVFYDGAGYWLADGFHRYAAAMQEFGASLQAPCDVRAGTQRDAMLHAASANASHGLRRTNADKRRAVLALLQDPEWSQWSDGEIAKRCAVSQPFVSGLRPKPAPPTHNGYESPAPAPAPITRKGSDGREYKVKPATPNYAQIYVLEGGIRGIKCTSLDLREAASRGEGWMWKTITDVLTSMRLEWRKADLVQAINNVAAQKEVKEAADRAARAAAPAPTPAPVSVANGKPMVEWTDGDWQEAKAKAVDADQAAANAARAAEAGELLDLYRKVIASEDAYSRLTGDFVGTIATKNAMGKMISGLERLVADLQ